MCNFSILYLRCSLIINNLRNAISEIRILLPRQHKRQMINTQSVGAIFHKSVGTKSGHDINVSLWHFRKKCQKKCLLRRKQEMF